MNKVIYAVAGLLILVGGFFAFNNYIYNEKQADEVSEVPDTVSDSGDGQEVEGVFVAREAGFAFAYDDEYIVDDMSDFVGEENADDVVAVYRIMNAEEKEELENSEGGREGPPTITVMVHDNPNNLSASLWVDENSRFSNIEMILGEADRDAVVGGANAVRYTSDGLYVTDNAVVAHGGLIYHFSGSYHEVDSVIHQDFKDLLESVEFVETPEQMEGEGGATTDAKIDVRVACESALAYMLFESGVEADQFIEECVRGEHPDVVERYVESIGLDGAAI